MELHFSLFLLESGATIEIPVDVHSRSMPSRRFLALDKASNLKIVGFESIKSMNGHVTEREAAISTAD